MGLTGAAHDHHLSPDLDGLLLQVLVTPEGQADPYPYYTAMRDEARVSRTAFGPYVVNGYEECLGVLRDPRLGRGVGIEDSSTGIFGDDGHPAGRIPRRLAAQHAALGPAGPHPAAPTGVALVHAPPGRTAASRHARAGRRAARPPGRAGEVDFMAEFACPCRWRSSASWWACPPGERAALQPQVRAAAKGIEPVLERGGDRHGHRRHHLPGRLLRRAARGTPAPARATTC